MSTVETRYAIDPQTAKSLDTQGLRDHFHAAGLFEEGKINLIYSHYDRLILGAAVPGSGELTLDHVKEAGTQSLLDRRELGILNIGDTGTVVVGGKAYEVGRGDVLYIGMGSGPVAFPGQDAFTSCPRRPTAPVRPA